MTFHRTLILPCAVALMAGITSAVVGAQDHKDPVVGGAGKVAASPQVDMTSGEVRKVDNDAKKITIKHEAIKNLDMPAMTMVFAVNDSAILGSLQAGDKIRFRAENIKGALTVIAIQPAK